MKERFASIGGIITSIFATVCCLGPVVLAALGIAELGLFSGFARLRPFFLILTFVFVGLAFRYAYGKRADCTKEKCDLGSRRRISRILFWVLVGFALFGVFSPYVTALFQ